MVKHILFVDDEPNILEGLQRMLWPMRKEWEMVFVKSGEDALKLMDKACFDVIVSDMRMPGMDGAELLREVRNRHPETVRFVLSGQSDEETIFRSVGPAHQFLAKPCNPKELKSCVERAFALRDLLGNKRLCNMISQIGALPVLPESYSRLTIELESPDASLSSVARIIESDVAMTAKVLQWVNSAFFGIRQRITSAHQAVSMLGLDIIKALVLVVGAFGELSKGATPPNAELMNKLWHHSMRVGIFAQKICRAENADEKVVGDAFTAGVLHDAGVLIIAANYSEEFREVLAMVHDSELPLSEGEMQALGCTHAQIGAFLLGIWGLPDSIVEAVAFHHHPSLCLATAFAPLTAVHIGNALDYHIHPGEALEKRGRVDTKYLGDLRLTERVPVWYEVCSEAGEKQEVGHG